MRTVDDYLNLITSYHKKRPKFVASLRAILEPLVARRDLILAMPGQYFDLDVAVGAQLDVVGLWVGAPRYIPEPLPNLWFSWDTPHKGWDEGFWKGPFDVGTMFERLDDDTYRRLIRTKIMSNNWDGTVPGAQAILDEFFIDPETYVMVEDEATVARVREWFAWDDPARGWDSAAVWYQPGATVSTMQNLDMRVTVAISGKIPPIVDLELFAQFLFPIQVGGVDQEVRVTSIDRTPLFGFDMDNEYVSGWDSGSWGVPPAYMVEQLR